MWVSLGAIMVQISQELKAIYNELVKSLGGLIVHIDKLESINKKKQATDYGFSVNSENAEKQNVYLRIKDLVEQSLTQLPAKTPQQHELVNNNLITDKDLQRILEDARTEIKSVI